jgi:hypothetical protein
MGKHHSNNHDHDQPNHPLDDVDPLLQRLVDAHPLIFRGRLPTTHSHVEPAWYDLIDGLLADFERELGPDGCKALQILQVKEKLGGLRLYYSLEQEVREGNQERLRDLLDLAEQQSRALLKPGGPCFELYSEVVLAAPLPSLQLNAGCVGVVVHIHDQGQAYEVEFVDGEQRTICVQTVPGDFLRLSSTDDGPHEPAGYEPDDGPLSAHQLQAIQQVASQLLARGQPLSSESLLDADPEACLTRDYKITIQERLAKDPEFREALEHELAAIKNVDPHADLA